MVRSRMQQRSARRRKRRLGAKLQDLTPVQWEAIKLSWGGCAYCGAVGVSLQKDCVIPISRGGRYTIDNVVPACRSCNSSKCDHEVTGWLRRKRLDEQAFLLRHWQVGARLLAEHPVDGP